MGPRHCTRTFINTTESQRLSAQRTCHASLSSGVLCPRLAEFSTVFLYYLFIFIYDYTPIRSLKVYPRRVPFSLCELSISSRFTFLFSFLYVHSAMPSSPRRACNRTFRLQVSVNKNLFVYLLWDWLSAIAVQARRFDAIIFQDLPSQRLYSRVRVRAISKHMCFYPCGDSRLSASEHIPIQKKKRHAKAKKQKQQHKIKQKTSR